MKEKTKEIDEKIDDFMNLITELDFKSKPFYKSRTLWLNFLAVIAVVGYKFWGISISPEMIAGILAILNLLLRFDTTEEIKTKGDKNA